MEPREENPPVNPLPFPPLILSAIQRNGLGMLVAIACGYALVEVYEDLKESNRVLLDLVKQQVDSSRAISDSLNSLSHRIEAHEQRMRIENNR